MGNEEALLGGFLCQPDKTEYICLPDKTDPNGTHLLPKKVNTVAATPRPCFRMEERNMNG